MIFKQKIRRLLIHPSQCRYLDIISTVFDLYCIRQRKMDTKLKERVQKPEKEGENVTGIEGTNADSKVSIYIDLFCYLIFYPSIS